MFDQFLAFVKAQPPEKTYEFCNTVLCPIAQFGRSLGYRGVRASSNYFTHDFGGRIELFNCNSSAQTALIKSQTFGQLAAALEALA